MSENVKKRVSKWDLASETDFPSETGQGDVQPVIAGETSGVVSKMDLKSLEDADGEVLKWPAAEVTKCSNWSDLEAVNAAMPSSGADGSHVSKWSDIKTDTRESNQEASSRRNEWGDINSNRDSSSLVTTHGQCYNQGMSPSFSARHQQNCNVSPEGGWNRSHRSRSRSRSQSQSRSRSRDYDRENRDRGGDRGWGRNRSRSKSPVHGFKRGGEGWGDKRRTGSGAPCRDFVAGRCKRGSECRYLHEDGGRKFYNRHLDAVELGENRYERGRSPGYHSKERTGDSMEQRDYPHEKVPHGHGSQYGGDWQKSEPHKNGGDNAICHDFRRGRCQRGSACKYIHHNASSDGGWEVKGRTRDRLQDGGDVKEFFHSDRRNEFRRASDTPCKFFAEGRCRNGDKCRFSHQEVVQNQTDGRSSDFMSVQNSDSENKIRWNGPTWDDLGSMASQNASAWKRDDWGSSATHATVGQESVPDLHDQQLKYAEDDSKYMALPMDVSQKALPAQVQSSSQENSSQQHQHVSTFSAAPVSQDVFIQQHSGVDRRDGSPRESDSIVINTLISRNEVSKIPHEDEKIPIKISRSLSETRFVSNLPANPAVMGQSSNQIGQNQFVIPQPSNSQSFNLAGQSQQPLVSSLAVNGQARLIVPQTALNMQGFNISSQNHEIPPPSFNGQAHQASHSLPSSHQSQFIAPQPPQNVNYSMEKQSHKPSQSISLDNQTQVGQEGQLRRADDSEMKASQTTSDPITQKVVTSEQVTQLSNLSASLAQIFGSGPQLPQLYAALNPYHGAGVVSPTLSHPGSISSLASTTATHVQPNQVSWTQQQCGPVYDSTDRAKVDTSNMPPGFSSDPIEQRSMTAGESQEPLKTIAALQSTDGTTKTVGSENNHETKHDMNGNNEPKEKGTVAGLSNEGPQTVRSEDPNADVQADEASKSNKDAKGTRLFRFALVEFVKDVLRPTWKEGHISKEAHKTIVKKVVDKVTATLDSNIPQTQERIDLYLSYSKEKLTKLVQAYMEKYLKT